MRPTRGLVSRSGVVPNSQTQDEVGLIANRHRRCLLLDVMAGYDATDPITAFGIGRTPKSYTHLLNKAALKGARIGVMTNLFGEAERHREVNRVMDGVISRMESLGATVVRFTCRSTTRSRRWSRRQRSKPVVMDRYFSTLGPNAPVRSFAQLVAAKSSAAQKTLEEELAADGMNSQDYKNRMLNRDKLRLAVAAKMADLKLDAILPVAEVLPVPISADDQAERNGTLQRHGLPGRHLPAGFSRRAPPRHLVSPWAPNCSGSTTRRTDFSHTPTRSSRRLACASRRPARPSFHTSRRARHRGS